jgi:hypothetical protein
MGVTTLARELSQDLASMIVAKSWTIRGYSAETSTYLLTLSGILSGICPEFSG